MSPGAAAVAPEVPAGDLPRLFPHTHWKPRSKLVSAHEETRRGPALWFPDAEPEARHRVTGCTQEAALPVPLWGAMQTRMLWGRHRHQTWAETCEARCREPEPWRLIQSGQQRYREPEPWRLTQSGQQRKTSTLQRCGWKSEWISKSPSGRKYL